MKSACRFFDDNCMFVCWLFVLERLVEMWRAMYECHQVQNHVSQQANHLDNSLGTYPTTDSHRQAISQLVAEVTSWHSSFCNLFRCQCEYIHVLRQWVRMTDCLPENNNLMGSSSSIHNFCDEVQGIVDQLPYKVQSPCSIWTMTFLVLYYIDTGAICVSVSL